MEHFGKVAKCKAGKIGVISAKRTFFPEGLVYIGVALDGSRWQSKDPEIIADNIDEYITHVMFVHKI